ncbi:MAG: DUF2312 domain-containing protein [Alphaproteobacteria bacterium CG_4_9_14_3_um_filter_47_13]|nr:MAG: DUF2312 domain-containing protein [Alphaproteobacteria bacterium CG_4_9_14_3_um_filter_47_13]
MSETNVKAFPIGNDGEPQDVAGVAGKRLKSFLDRIERLEEEKAALAEDIKDVYGEAKATGFDPKIMKKVLKIKNMDADKRQEEEALIELYKAAIGIE